MLAALIAILLGSGSALAAPAGEAEPGEPDTLAAEAATSTPSLASRQTVTWFGGYGGTGMRPHGFQPVGGVTIGRHKQKGGGYSAGEVTLGINPAVPGIWAVLPFYLPAVAFHVGGCSRADPLRVFAGFRGEFSLGALLSGDVVMPVPSPVVRLGLSTGFMIMPRGAGGRGKGKAGFRLALEPGALVSPLGYPYVGFAMDLKVAAVF